jgi:hypothetical protein
MLTCWYCTGIQRIDSTIPIHPGSTAAARKPSVGYNGNLLVGKAYTGLLDFKPGDEFEIKLDRKQIRWVSEGA